MTTCYGLVAYAVVTRRLPLTVVEAAFNRGWNWVIGIVDACLVFDVRPAVSRGIVGIMVLWLLVVAAE
eukprot:gene29083-57276_t